MIFPSSLLADHIFILLSLNYSRGGETISDKGSAEVDCCHKYIKMCIHYSECSNDILFGARRMSHIWCASSDGEHREEAALEQHPSFCISLVHWSVNWPLVLCGDVDTIPSLTRGFLKTWSIKVDCKKITPSSGLCLVLSILEPRCCPELSR